MFLLYKNCISAISDKQGRTIEIENAFPKIRECITLHNYCVMLIPRQERGQVTLLTPCGTCCLWLNSVYIIMYIIYFVKNFLLLFCRCSRANLVRIDSDAGTHCRCNCTRLNVLTLCSFRLCLDDSVKKSVEVFHQLVCTE